MPLSFPSTPETHVSRDRTSPQIVSVALHRKFKEAIDKQDFDTFQALIEDDPALAIIPIKSVGRIEDPMCYALQNRCPEAILKLLLSDNGNISERRLATKSLIFLAQMTTSPLSKGFQKGVFPFPLPCGSFFDAEPPCTSMALQQEETIVTVDDEYEVSVALYILRCGASASRKDVNGMSAVQHALKAGKLGLSELFENWHCWQQCMQSIHLRLLPLSRNLAGNVVTFLVPESWQLKMPKSEYARTHDNTRS